MKLLSSRQRLITSRRKLNFNFKGCRASLVIADDEAALRAALLFLGVECYNKKAEYKFYTVILLLLYRIN